MSWMQRLYDTYEQALRLTDLPRDAQIMPVSHTLQNAHINVVIDGEGHFLRARVLKKTQVVLPATESSAGRSSGEAPHPLADKLQYVAKDYAAYGGQKNAYFASYQKQLNDWCASAFAHPQAQAVLSYVNQGTLIKDLVAHQIAHVDEQQKLLTRWTQEGDAPEIFSTLPKTAGVIEQGDALVCWTVEVAGELDIDTWKNRSLQQSWVDFEASQSTQQGLCYVSGKTMPMATNHPAKLRHTGDKAKLISSNDSSGFTFRGRFIEGEQAAGIGFEVTQKAHNALRWLIARQGFKNSDQVVVAWAQSHQSIPAPINPTLVYGDEDDDDLNAPTPESALTSEAGDLDYGEGIGQLYAHKLKLKMKGYQQKLQPNEQITVMAVDSATPGRMGVVYYCEKMQEDYFVALENWYTQFAWYQRHTEEMPVEGKKAKTKVVWPIAAPTPLTISQAAYGQTLSDTLKKQTVARLLPCIVEGQNIPFDLVQHCFRKACNPNACEPWEWERNLGVACALFRGYYLRMTDDTQRRNYTMALDPTLTSRDYLYGRLLAVAEKLESIALSIAGEKRRTTAERYMQQFAERPFSTWRNIGLALDPYKSRLNSHRKGFLVKREQELEDIYGLFDPAEYCLDSPLSGEFLLGYHCQKMTYRKNKQDTKDGGDDDTADDE